MSSFVVARKQDLVFIPIVIAIGELHMGLALDIQVITYVFEAAQPRTRRRSGLILFLWFWSRQIRANTCNQCPGPLGIYLTLVHLMECNK
jgi:hypothetical protein